MPGYAEGQAMDERPVFEPETYSQVKSLLGADRTRSLLLMLRSLVVTLAGLCDASLVSPAGLAFIHRLKSEAGLMGFSRLSKACEAFDEPGRDTAPCDGAVMDLRSALTSTLLVTNELSESDVE